MSEEWGIKNPDAWLSVAFDRIADTLRHAAPGARNVALRNAGYKWGRIRHVANGSATAYDDMLASIALNTGLNRKEVQQTLSRAIRDGRTEPTQHYVAPDADHGTGPKLRIHRSAIDPQDRAEIPIDLKEPRKTTTQDAVSIWRAAIDALGTPAEAYLRRRGLEPHQIAAEVRYGRSRDFHYAIFPIRNDAGDVVALQRVSIDESGEPYADETGRKRKLTVGPSGDGAFVALDTGPNAIVCEGPEDALSIAAALMERGEAANVKAALTTPRRLLAEGVTVFADRDGGLDDLIAAATDAGAIVCAPDAPHKDANDLWQAEGADGILRALEAAQEPEPLFAPASVFEGLPVPSRKWLIEDLIPDRTVTMLGGDGGTGKSLLALQLAIACAAARRWIGYEIARPGMAMMLSAEDDRDELHIRMNDVLEREGVEFAALDNLLIRSLAGEDTLLATLDRKTNALVPTPLYARLDREMSRAKPRLLILDTLADLHSGEENNRGHARQFIGMLRHLAITHECAVVLLAHPSLTGMSSGSGLSGSTAWNGSVRSRLYFERVMEDGIEPDKNLRRLVTKKSNYGPAGGEIVLRWEQGAFIRESGGDSLDRMAQNAKAQRAFLNCLDVVTRQGRWVTHTTTRGYAPKVFAAMKEADGCTKRVLTEAMEALFSAGKIRVGNHGRPSDPRAHIERAGGENT